MSSSSSSPEQSPLGKSSAYADQYDATLLFPIPRETKRKEIGVDDKAPPFFGADLWTAYEVSWLNAKGKPQVALAHFTIPCESPNIVESKSFKLYLNSFNNSRFTSVEEVRDAIRADVSEAVWRGSNTPRTIGLQLVLAEAFETERMGELSGLLLDRLDIECDQYTPDPSLLTANHAEAPVSEELVSHLLKSNCLVTGQPDWGSVQISYSGAQIDQEGLLKYIVSFRNHNEFHEQCVERIFMDIWTRCKPIKLSVYARYTRRGGLDINPLRTSHPQALPKNLRNARQ